MKTPTKLKPLHERLLGQTRGRDALHALLAPNKKELRQSRKITMGAGRRMGGRR